MRREERSGKSGEQERASEEKVKGGGGSEREGGGEQDSNPTCAPPFIFFTSPFTVAEIRRRECIRGTQFHHHPLTPIFSSLPIYPVTT